MIKRLVIEVVILDLLFVGWAVGRFGSRTVRFVPDPQRSTGQITCTCVPCLPDLYCLKCGHRSRECPRLRDHFSPSNSVKVVTK